MGTFAGGVIVEPSRSFLGSGEVAAVSGLLPHSQGSRVLFSLLSLFFFPWYFLLWVFLALLVLSDASSFFCFSARFMLLGSFFAWVYFLLELFFLAVKPLGEHAFGFRRLVSKE
jgi:hypothetical protein